MLRGLVNFHKKKKKAFTPLIYAMGENLKHFRLLFIRNEEGKESIAIYSWRGW